MKINKAIIKIIGMIEYPADYEETLKRDGYKIEEDILSKKGRLASSNYYKNSYYPEVRKMLFVNEEDYSSVKTYQKVNDNTLTFYKGKEGTSYDEIKLTGSEVYLFPEKNRLGMFSLQLELENCTDSEVSDINYFARTFISEMKSNTEENKMKWIDWIEKNILCGEKIHGDNVKADDYSGSKFKVFTVIDTKESQNYEERCLMLYDVGTGSPNGSASGLGSVAPSKSYYDLLMKDTVSVFRNWDALALFDSYTVVGNGLLGNTYAEKSYTTTYFRIYIFNLYVKYNLFQFKAELHLHPLLVRHRFDNFINKYNLSQIAFDFLPNIIYHTQRKALLIDDELIKFNERINKISDGIQEKQQKRTNALLTFVSIVASAGSVVPIYNNLEEIKNYFGFSTNIFYTILGILILLIAFFLYKYIFSESYKTLNRKIKKSKLSIK